MNFPIHTFIVLLLIIGIFVFQFYLSRCKSKWPGLVIPILCFILSILYPLNFAAPDYGVGFVTILTLLLIWLIGNIPTIIMLAIYFAAREKSKRRKQIDKIDIQNL